MKKRFFSLLLAVVLLLTVIPMASAQTTDDTFRVPIAVHVNETIAAIEMELRLPEGIEYVKWVRSDVIKNAAYIDNFANGIFAQTGILKIGIFNASNKYSPTNGILDLGYLEFKGDPAGLYLEFVKAKHVVVISKDELKSTNCLVDLIIDLSAFPTAIVAQGVCGENLTCVLTADGTLTINGSGAMTEYADAASVPWDAYRGKIKTLSLPKDITTISDAAFSGCTGLEDVYYNSTPSDWAKISIGDENEPLLNAELHTLPEPAPILSLKLSDSSGGELDSIPTGNFRVEAVLSEQAPAGTVLLAAYTANGQMVSAVCSTSAQFTNNGNIAEVKAFLLTSLGNPAPLCEAVTVR
jgi:hypothetical protein